jgi:Asp-tRNA(Asn)/Glu-tRNA(Gln) amidotransferase B subunit
MKKVEQVLLALLFSSMDRSSEHKQKVCPVISKLIINEVLPLMMAEDTLFEEMDEYHYGFHEVVADCAVLEAYGVITSRHSRVILKDIFTKYICYDVITYLLETGLLDEVSGDSLKTLISDVLRNPVNAKIIQNVKSGNVKALGALIGPIMKQVKADPNSIREMLMVQIAEMP